MPDIRYTVDLQYVCFNTDVNECMEETACCDSLCNNEDGGYSCSCHDGHFLSKDNCTCQGNDIIETASSSLTKKCQQILDCLMEPVLVHSYDSWCEQVI